jgi:hypothetical protein
MPGGEIAPFIDRPPGFQINPNSMGEDRDNAITRGAPAMAASQGCAHSEAFSALVGRSRADAGGERDCLGAVA